MVTLAGSQAQRRRLTWLGALFHAGIAGLTGLTSFGLAMVAALLVGLVHYGEPLLLLPLLRLPALIRSRHEGDRRAKFSSTLLTTSTPVAVAQLVVDLLGAALALALVGALPPAHDALWRTSDGGLLLELGLTTRWRPSAARSDLHGTCPTSRRCRAGRRPQPPTASPKRHCPN